MSYDEDYLFALQLQNELDALEQNEALPEVSVISNRNLNLFVSNCECNRISTVEDNANSKLIQFNN